MNNDLVTLVFLVVGAYMFFRAIFGYAYSKDPVDHSGSCFTYGLLCFGIATYAQIIKVGNG